MSKSHTGMKLGNDDHENISSIDYNKPSIIVKVVTNCIQYQSITRIGILNKNVCIVFLSSL